MIRSLREARAEKRCIVQELEQERKRLKRLEDELDMLKNDDQFMSLEDLGVAFIKMLGTRQDAPLSFTCPSVEEKDSLASMPGVHRQRAMDYSKSIC
jgi:hypothetical protein